MRVIKFVLLVVVLLVGWWEVSYGFASQFIQTSMPRVDSKGAAKSQLEHSAGATLTQKVGDAESAFRKGQISLAERDARIAQANADNDHDLEVAASLRSSHSTAPVPSPVPPPPSPTASGTRLDTPAPKVVELDKGKEWSVVLPANLEYRTGILVRTGQTVTFVDWIGQVKLDPKETFTNQPAGSFDTSRAGLTFAEPFVSSQAWVGALLARVGEQYNDVGGRQSSSFVAASDEEIILSVNCLQGERHNASGSYAGVIELK